MQATFSCPHCDKPFRADDAAGNLVRCPACLEETRVPAPTAPKAVVAYGATGVARRATLVVQATAPGAATKSPVQSPDVQAIATPPPVVFLCPTCRARFTVPHDMVGQKVDCHGCSQRVKVPTPPPLPLKHTVLGQLVAGQPPGQRPPSAGPRQPNAQQAPASARQPPATKTTSTRAQAPSATPLASVLAVVRRFHASRLSLRAGAIVLAVVLVGVLACAFVAMRSPIATERVGGRPNGSGGYRLIVPRPGQSSGEAFYEQLLLDSGKN